MVEWKDTQRISQQVSAPLFSLDLHSFDMLFSAVVVAFLGLAVSASPAPRPAGDGQATDRQNPLNIDSATQTLTLLISTPTPPDTRVGTMAFQVNDAVQLYKRAGLLGDCESC